MVTVILALAQDLRELREPTVKAAVKAVRSVRASGASLSTSENEINNVPSREIYLMVAGSKSHASNLDIHNKQSDRSSWDKAWTSGEQIFADLCQAIGMENFGPRQKLWAELLDVGSSDGLKEIANEMQQALVRKYCDKVDQVLVVLPPHVLESEQGKEAMETTRRVFSDVWSKQLGSLLGNVPIDFVI